MQVNCVPFGALNCGYWLTSGSSVSQVSAVASTSTCANPVSGSSGCQSVISSSPRSLHSAYPIRCVRSLTLYRMQA